MTAFPAAAYTVNASILLTDRPVNERAQAVRDFRPHPWSHCGPGRRDQARSASSVAWSSLVL